MLIPLIAALALAAEPLHHELEVSLDPAAHTLSATDTLSLDGPWTFQLHAGLSPEVRTEGWTLEPAQAVEAETAVPLEAWTLTPASEAPEAVTLAWSGPIHHPIEQVTEEYQRSFAETAGTIGDQGVFLGGAAWWVPTEPGRMHTFELTVSGLQGLWTVVSQGQRTLSEEEGRTVHWSMAHPTEEVWLVAGQWHTYTATADDVEVMAFLRQDDPALARRYLAATDRYLRMYESILPPYPYASFALVENFWETGYGMPGFTLLGPQVIRFPWIISSSYPHEILHNWWGNGVYPDWESGNWTEGITAYLADHMLAEQKGEGTRYRRDTLKRYTDYVSEGEDFPLVDFHSRHSAATEAVGYGKSLMTFHMARRRAGDEAFTGALSRFYTEHEFGSASWADLQASFEAETGRDWGPFFTQWTTRTSAPELRLEAVTVKPLADGSWTVRVDLRQLQDGKPFQVDVPVALTVEGSEEPVWMTVPLRKRKGRVQQFTAKRPLRVDVDPAFDLMRRLDPLEVEPTLGTLLGDEAVTFVLPSHATEPEQAAWRALAQGWAPPDTEAHILLDSELDGLPAGPVWVLGWTNTHGPAVAARLAGQGVSAPGQSLILDGRTLTHTESAVLVSRDPSDPQVAAAWVTGPVQAIPGLARKLPHYGRYGYLALEGHAPDNVDKGVWAPLSSPLAHVIEEGAVLSLPEREPLAPLPPKVDPKALLATATELSDPSFAGRGLGTEGLRLATELVEERMAALGLQPAGDEGFAQTWELKHPGGEVTLTNLLGLVPGTNPDLADSPVLVMAHLDHLGTEGDEVFLGADDNASGVAVLLALAAERVQAPGARPVLFAFTTGEEHGLMGSKHLMEDLSPHSCIAIDSVGRLQDTGKIYVLDAGSAYEWPHAFRGVGFTTGAPIAISKEPLDASDHGACLAKGIPGVQLTTGPTADYHKPSDTPDKLDAAGMATVLEVVDETVGWLAELDKPLTAQGERPTGGHPGAAQGERRTSLGTVPDFAHEGMGVKVQELVPGSAAEKAGIQPGDLVVGIGDDAIKSLREMGAVLRKHEPGETVDVRIMRDGRRLTVEATLTERK